jgi:phosphoribosylformylglycinamidine synthase
MMFIAHIRILPLKELLDPQGKAVLLGLQHLHIAGVKEVRVGKYVTLELEADSEAIAKKLVQEACDKLLCNRIMEFYDFSLEKK